jgi:hypothetical protein
MKHTGILPFKGITLALALGIVSAGLVAQQASAQPSWYTPPDSTGEITEQGLNRQAHRSGAPVVIVKSEEAAVVSSGAFCGSGSSYPGIPGMVAIASGGGTCFYPYTPNPKVPAAEITMPNNTTLIVAGMDLSAPLPWQDAINACNAYSTSEYGGGWALPTREELTQMYNMRGMIPSLSMGPSYWSATEYASTSAWYRRFSDGVESGTSKTTQSQVRCVRR